MQQRVARGGGGGGGTKLKNGQKFLQGGDRLKVTIRFRGREMAHTNIGEQLLRDFAAKCADIANLDKQPKLEGRNMSMFLSPKNSIKTTFAISRKENHYA